MKCQCQSPFSHKSVSSLEYEKLNKSHQDLQRKKDKLTNENTELRKINRNLNSKLNVLINDNDIVKDIKLEIQDYSDFTYFHNEDYLKEFFYLLVLCEKMKYIDIDHIWLIESANLYKDVQLAELAFYQWGGFITKRLEMEFQSKFGAGNSIGYSNGSGLGIGIGIGSKNNETGMISKLK